MAATETFVPSLLGEERVWDKLRKMKPEDVCRRASVRFETNGFYAVVFMGQAYHIYVDEERIDGPAGDELASNLEFELLLLTYLVSAQDVPFSGKQVSEKELQGGSLFFQGPHALPKKPLIKRFGKNPEKFLEIGAALGGARIAYGDAAIEFLALPRIIVGFVLWAEDEEFPANVTFLFDSSLESHLPLDVVFALVRCVVKAIASYTDNV